MNRVSIGAVWQKINPAFYIIVTEAIYTTVGKLLKNRKKLLLVQAIVEAIYQKSSMCDMGLLMAQFYKS